MASHTILHEKPVPNQIVPTIDSLLARGLVWEGGSSPHAALSFNDPTQRECGIPFTIPEIDSVLPHQGLERGAIHEFFYNDPLQPLAFPRCVPSLIARSASSPQGARDRWHSDTLLPRVVWIGRDCWPTPYSLNHTNSNTPSSLLASSLFIDPPTERLALWAIEAALRSRAVGLVVATCPKLSLSTTRRLSLAARNHNTTALLLRNKRDKDSASCAATKWLITPTQSQYETPLWEISLIKIKGGVLRSSSWIVGIHEENSNVSMRVFSRMGDRCHEEENHRARYGT